MCVFIICLFCDFWWVILCIFSILKGLLGVRDILFVICQIVNFVIFLKFLGYCFTMLMDFMEGNPKAGP